MDDTNNLAWQSLQDLFGVDVEVPPVLMLRMVCASGQCPIRRCDECPSMKTIDNNLSTAEEVRAAVGRHLLEIANLDKDRVPADRP
jgi:hypothetical protein